MASFYDYYQTTMKNPKFILAILALLTTSAGFNVYGLVSEPAVNPVIPVGKPVPHDDLCREAIRLLGKFH
jgi:hypothetical protein